LEGLTVKPSDVLKMLREVHRKTQEEVAREMGVNQSFVGQYEAGKSMGVRVIERFAKYYHVPPELLLGGVPLSDACAELVKLILKLRQEGRDEEIDAVLGMARVLVSPTIKNPDEGITPEEEGRPDSK
jgi:transcriptional regulator with XRE-family HTH domain